MRFRRFSMGMVLAFLVFLPTKARADYIYTISYNALNNYQPNAGGPTFSYPADSFSFTVSSLITGAGLQTIPGSSGELNGLLFPSVLTQAGTFRQFFVDTIWAGKVTGDVVALQFNADGLANAVGVWPSTAGAGRAIFNGNGGASYIYVGGTLTITDTSTVPEPASLLLLGTGLVGLARWRRRRT